MVCRFGNVAFLKNIRSVNNTLCYENSESYRLSLFNKQYNRSSNMKYTVFRSAFIKKPRQFNHSFGAEMNLANPIFDRRNWANTPQRLVLLINFVFIVLHIWRRRVYQREILLRLYCNFQNYFEHVNYTITKINVTLLLISIGLISI